MKLLAMFAAVLIAASTFAADAPATQPATAEAPATQPAEKNVKEEKRGKVTVTLKNAADVWVIFPKELRPKEGKLTDEQIDGLKAWAKENKGKYNAELGFSTTKATRTNGKNAQMKYSIELVDKGFAVEASAGVGILEWQKRRPEAVAASYNVMATLKGDIEEIKISKKDGVTEITFHIEDPKVVSMVRVPKN